MPPPTPQHVTLMPPLGPALGLSAPADGSRSSPLPTAIPTLRLESVTQKVAEGCSEDDCPREKPPSDCHS